MYIYYSTQSLAIMYVDNWHTYNIPRDQLVGNLAMIVFKMITPRNVIFPKQNVCVGPSIV